MSGPYGEDDDWREDVDLDTADDDVLAVIRDALEDWDTAA